jgi:hypothetical protein
VDAPTWSALMRVYSFVLTLMALFVGVVPSASAQTDLWLPDASGAPDIADSEVESVFEEILGGASGDAHIVGLAGIESRLRETGMPLPRCLRGLDVCRSPVEAAAQSLGVDRVITVVVGRAGRTGTLQIRNIEQDSVDLQEVSAEGLRELAYSAISAVTGLTGVLEVSSSPSDARVSIGGEVVGVTPYRSTLSIGAYRVEVGLEGYTPYSVAVEVRAGDLRQVSAELVRRFAEVTFVTDVGFAQVFVDGDAMGQPVGSSLEIEPGERQVVVRATDYTDVPMTLNLQAGEERDVTVTLLRTQESLGRERRRAINSFPLLLEFGANAGIFRTDWEGARVRLDDDRTRIRCRLDSETGGCRGVAGVGLVGLELNAVYNWRAFELEVLGLGVQRVRLRGDDKDYALRDDLEVLNMRAGRLWTIRLPHLGFRVMLTPFWEVFARTGLSVGRYTLQSRSLNSDEQTRTRRGSLLWDIRVGGRAHLSTRFFAHAAMELGFDTTHRDTSPRLTGVLGVGIRLNDPLRLNERLDRQFPPRGTRSTEAAP